MKFKIQMKDPDGVSCAVEEAAKASVQEAVGISDDERDAIVERRIENLAEKISKWFTYGEYLTVEIDTDAGTISVCESRLSWNKSENRPRNKVAGRSQ